jgi:hypothetical protein
MRFPHLKLNNGDQTQSRHPSIANLLASIAMLELTRLSETADQTCQSLRKRLGYLGASPHQGLAERTTLMSKIHCYDYVNHPYEEVRSALSKDAPGVFQAATKAAASRAQSIAAQLRIEIGGIGIEADIHVSVKDVEVRPSKAMSGPVTRLQLEWEASRMANLFPLMKADLSIYPITATETQLDFDGLYQPPLGPLGKAMNAMAGHRIAEACVHRFVSDVAEYLRKTLH